MTNNERREKLNTIIFGTGTPAGRNFDIALIWLILISVVAVMLDSIEVLNSQLDVAFHYAEWTFTILFTLEYITRIYCSPRPWKYIFSFYGLIDLVSILPTYLALLLPPASYFLVIRLLRVMRIFRILKLIRYIREGNTLLRSMYQSRRKIYLFFIGVLVLSTVFGTLMFLVEGPENGFTSIPKSIYWTIVTITTVGYGDITPHTVLGQLISTAAMLTGYSIIAVPTGILTAELATEIQRDRAETLCVSCGRYGHDNDAQYCKFCGEELEN